jgi:hypothetical protein
MFESESRVALAVLGNLFEDKSVTGFSSSVECGPLDASIGDFRGSSIEGGDIGG